MKFLLGVLLFLFTLPMTASAHDMDTGGGVSTHSIACDFGAPVELDADQLDGDLMVGLEVATVDNDFAAQMEPIGSNSTFANPLLAFTEPQPLFMKPLSLFMTDLGSSDASLAAGSPSVTSGPLRYPLLE